MRLHAEIALTAPDAAPLGARRIALLEAIGREGGISAAARALGLSYRGAWDAIRAMNNLVGRPLVAGQPGGARGGGARLTEDGLRLVESFRRLEAEMARAFNALAPDLAGEEAAARLMFGGFLATSARNALRGAVETVAEGAVNAEVALRIAPEALLRVSLTSRSLRALGLFPGRPAIALVKAPMIALVPAADPGRCANRIEGEVARVERDATSAEIIVDIGAGKTLCAVRSGGAELPAFAPGDRVAALIDPAHVILAVE
ncbi:TOBE domain-containing protein [Amaricoccus solimangrovi]|uniref:LysR family transcriptional regulator n=1 Tax=Amaricoccus solimangrovi TaxID=2589815 RepID=A0A501WQP6_9RHOB|nr:TOBE domain-containing protein [Amaricoccus solimangrovi]TPE51678.1 LysR family transcriptional regulator [Amaricoccus solimangrovi]